VSQDIMQQEPSLEQLQSRLSEQNQLVQQLQHRLSQGEAENQQLKHDLQQQHVLADLKGPKPPETNGKTPTPEHFTEAFEVYMAQKQLDPDTPAACSFAALFLRDAAMDWYTQHLRDVAAGLSAPFSTWQQFKGAFIRHFAPFDRQQVARDKLDRLVQTRSVSEYSSQFVDLMLQLPTMDMGSRVHYFVRGLKAAVSKEVVLRQPQDLETAISMAVVTDTTLYNSGMVGRSSFGSKGGSSSGYHGGFSGGKQFGGSAGPNGGPAPMDLGSMQQQQQSAPGGSRPYCSWHKRPGHWTRDCRARARKLSAQHAAGAAGKQ
jgi:hypothetical protein